MAYGNSKATFIYRRGPSDPIFTPWLVIAPSATLECLGKRGLGLYVAKYTRRGTILGRYEGTVVVNHPTRDCALDGSSAADIQPCIPRDSRGTRYMPNCVREQGYLRVTRSSMPAFNLNLSVRDNIDAEVKMLGAL